MADASITLKITPAEFDLLREVMKMERDRSLEISRDKDIKDAAFKHKQTQYAARCEDFLRKLR